MSVSASLPSSLKSTLPGRYYADPAVFAWEQARIFEATWFAVARSADLASPGSFRTAEVGRESVIVIRGRDGALRAGPVLQPQHASGVAVAR